MHEDQANNTITASRIDWLDGLRAIAVSIVILSHLSAFYRWSFEPPGKLGVFIFFGISGFIVTRLLLREFVQTADINFGAFFARRSARILPPLAIYIGVCVALGQGDVAGALRAASFTCNIAKGPGDCGWIFGQTWSLAFEEQYYLLVPFLMLRRARWAFAITVPLALLPLAFPLSFVGRIGAIQIYMLLGLGALLALQENRLFALFAKIPPILAFSLIALSAIWPSLNPGPLQIATGILVPFAVIIGFFSLALSSNLMNRFLSSLPMRTLGLYSYTLYLWQQLAFTNPPLIPAPLGLVLSLTFAAISYHTIEQIVRNIVKKPRTSKFY